MAMITSDRTVVADAALPEIAELEATPVTGDDPGRASVLRQWSARLVDGRPTNWAKVGFVAVLAVFVSAILASYAVPLWFQIHGERLLVVTSGSMAPEIEVGDSVVIQQVTSASQLRVGQIVTFYPTGSSTLITHRIIGLAHVDRVDDAGDVVDAGNGKPLSDPYIKTKGDANLTADPNLTPASQVRGIVRAVYPRWGFALAWAHSGVGRLVLFAPPLLALAASELLSRAGTTPRGLLARLRTRRSPVEDADDGDEGDPDAPRAD